MIVSKETTNTNTLKIHSLLSEVKHLTNKKFKASTSKGIPLTVENLKLHNSLLPPSKELRYTRISQYVQHQTQQLQTRDGHSEAFILPTLEPLEDRPFYDSFFQDMDDSVSVRHHPRGRSSKAFGTRFSTLMHKFFPSFYSTYPSGQVYW